VAPAASGIFSGVAREDMVGAAGKREQRIMLPGAMDAPVVAALPGRTLFSLAVAGKRPDPPKG
jgi:hypothetical protein